MKTMNAFSFALGILTMTIGLVHAEDLQKPAARPEFAIAIHGGAGRSPDDFTPEENANRRESLKAALSKGVEILKNGGTSLDAVEQVIRILEDDPQFNAGKGAVYNAAGSHELDASIMDGAELKCGAVAGVSHVKNPISLARLVMTETTGVRTLVVSRRPPRPTSTTATSTC